MKTPSCICACRRAILGCVASAVVACGGGADMRTPTPSTSGEVNAISLPIPAAPATIVDSSVARDAEVTLNGPGATDIPPAHLVASATVRIATRGGNHFPVMPPPEEVVQ